MQENGEYSSSYWESKSMKSSASDYSLTGHFRRGNMLYHSDRSMERSTQFRRRGSFSSEVIGDCYYENLRGTSDERENFLESYDKLLEIHQDTVRQISEATVFKCDCKQLQGTDWNDFEIRGKMLNYGISSYVTVPVSVKRGGKRMEEKYTAWVSLVYLLTVSLLHGLVLLNRFLVLWNLSGALEVFFKCRKGRVSLFFCS